MKQSKIINKLRTNNEVSWNLTVQNWTVFISLYRSQSELPRPIKIRPRMYVRRSIMYEKAAFCSPEENSSVAR